MLSYLHFDLTVQIPLLRNLGPLTRILQDLSNIQAVNNSKSYDQQKCPLVIQFGPHFKFILLKLVVLKCVCQCFYHYLHFKLSLREQKNPEFIQEGDDFNFSQAELHKKEIELSLEKEQNKRFWDENTDNSITMDQLRRQLNNRNVQLQSMERALKEMRVECRRQMECQVGDFDYKPPT